MAKSDSVARVLALAAIGSGGGGTGTTDYLQLANKPQINSVELTGNKTLEDLGINVPDIDETTISKNAEGKIEAIGVKDVKTSSADKFWTGTTAEYDALGTYDDNTFYAITDDDDTAVKAEVGAELNGSYADNVLSMSLLNPYSETLSKIEVSIPAATQDYVDSEITEHNTLYYATIEGTNDNWYTKDKLQPVLQAAYDGGYHDIMIRTTSGSRFITSSGLDLQTISETVSANLQFVNLQNLTGSTTAPNTIFYGYCYANTVKLDSEGNVVISGSVGKAGGSIKVMKESALTDITGYDASKTQVLKNVNGALTWVNEE